MNRRKKKVRNDLILIAAVVLIALAAGLCVFFLPGEGDYVEVSVDGQLFGTYPLSRDTVVEIRTGDGKEQLNLFVIRNGKAYVERATCPDGICAAHLPIGRSGESIVCLPHRVVITVHTAEDTDEADIIT